MAALLPLAHMPANHGRSWADCEDEDSGAEAERYRWEASEDEISPKESRSLSPEEKDDFLDEVQTTDSAGGVSATARAAAILAAGGSTSEGAQLPSVGSLYHRSARCKPCAFFHTKGCQNGSSCLFCHLCPPHEKQRRKRLREHMREQLGQRARNIEGKGSFKPPGHFRHPSGSSGTSSTCTGGSMFSHSRQSSGCSSIAAVSTTDGNGSVHGNDYMCPMMPVHCGLVQPVFTLTPSMMQHIGEPTSSRSDAAEHKAGNEGEDDLAQITNQTCKADGSKDCGHEQTVVRAPPIMDNVYQQPVAYGGPWPAQFTYGSTPTYIVPVPVPVPVQMQQHQHVPHGCVPPRQIAIADGLQWQMQPHGVSSITN